MLRVLALRSRRVLGGRGLSDPFVMLRGSGRRGMDRGGGGGVEPLFVGVVAREPTPGDLTAAGRATVAAWGARAAAGREAAAAAERESRAEWASGARQRGEAEERELAALRAEVQRAGAQGRPAWWEDPTDDPADAHAHAHAHAHADAEAAAEPAAEPEAEPDVEPEAEAEAGAEADVEPEVAPAAVVEPEVTPAAGAVGRDATPGTAGGEVGWAVPGVARPAAPAVPEAGLAALGEAVDRLAAADLTLLGDGQLLDGTETLLGLADRLHNVVTARVACAVGRDAVMSQRCQSTAGWIADVLRARPAAGRRLAGRARRWAAHPAVLAAAVAGDLGVDLADDLTDTLQRFDPAHRHAAAGVLVPLATRATGRQVAAAAGALRAALHLPEPDDGAAVRRAARQGLDLTPVGEEVRLRGWLSAADGALLDTALTALLRRDQPPHPSPTRAADEASADGTAAADGTGSGVAGADGTSSGGAGAQGPAADGGPAAWDTDLLPTRSVYCRRGQALVALAQHTLDTADLPTTAGTLPRLVVHVDWPDLADPTAWPTHPTSGTGGGGNPGAPGGAGAGGTGTPGAPGGTIGTGRAGTDTDTGAHTGTGAGALPDGWPAGLAPAPRGGQLPGGQTLHPATVRQLACDALVLPVLLASRSRPLDVGRDTPTWTPAQRAAVTARSTGTCETPRCTALAEHIHHLWHWACGGPTDLTNAAHLCRLHHWAVHHTTWDLHGPPDHLTLHHHPRPGNETARQGGPRRAVHSPNGGHAPGTRATEPDEPSDED